MSKISMDKKYITRDGRKANVLSTSVNHPSHPVVAVVHGETLDHVYQYSATGRLYPEGFESIMDLREEDHYEPGEEVEVNTFLGWRPWYVYHSRLEEGIHLVKMDVLSSDRHRAEDSYHAVRSQDLRIRQE